MATRSYYRNVFQRKNIFKEFLSTLFQGIASYPRLVLEVFIKGQFGVRYFNLMSVITMAIILSIIPIIGSNLSRSFYGRGDTWDIVWEHKFYYLFIAAFVLMSIKRYKEIRQPWGVVDPSKFTLSMGTPDPWLGNLKINGKSIDGRYREVFVEPAIFLVIGIPILLISPLLGMLLITFSIIYCLSFYFAYSDGDDWVMDINDERISAERFRDNFVDDRESDESGFQYRGAKPRSKEDREKIYNSTLDDDDDIAH